MLRSDQRQQLLSICGESVRFDEPMRRHTTLKIGGPADAFVAPASVQVLVKLLKYCARQSLPITTVGAGSNLLVLDGGIRGVVLSTRNLRSIERQGATGIRVQAGVSTGKLLRCATQWELGGLEFLGGVPGSVGGGLVMNAGTLLGEFCDVVAEVQSLQIADGAQVSRTNEECGFVYRGSSLPKSEVVVDAVLALESRPAETIKKAVRALRERRREREPKGANNAGSVFKNPEGDYAGRLLEAIGLKGVCVGGAQCSAAHANWFVNLGSATARDMLTLIDRARTDVREQHGIELQLEWKCVGEHGDDWESEKFAGRGQDRETAKRETDR